MHLTCGTGCRLRLPPGPVGWKRWDGVVGSGGLAAAGAGSKRAAALLLPWHGTAWLVRLPNHSQLTMRPSKASTSRTSVPFARPPMEGLQLISPMEATGEGVTSTVRAPRRAAAAAASQPACPPPTTTTSTAVAAAWAAALSARRHAGRRLLPPLPPTAG